MKKKWLIAIILMFAMVQIVTALECQISEDNATWIGFNSTIIGGCLNDDDGIGYAQNLQKGTTYHIRCRNSTADWGYITQATGGGKVFEGTFIAIVLIGITGMFVYLSAQHKENKPFQIFFMLAAFAMMFVSLRFATLTTEAIDDASFDPTIQANIVDSLTSQYGIFVKVFVFFLTIAVISLLFMSYRAFSGYKKKKSIMDREEKENEFF